MYFPYGNYNRFCTKALKIQPIRLFYIDVELPYPDAKVAATLCVGGPIKYSIRAESGISDDWILRHVCPQIESKFPRKTSIVLGRALLWAIYDEELGDIIDPQLSERVKTAATQVASRLPPLTNPIRKVPLLVTGYDGALTIKELTEEEENAGAPAGGLRNNGEVRLLLSAVSSLRRQNDELKNEIHLFKMSTNTLLHNMNSSIRRLAMVPVMTPRRRQLRDSSGIIEEEHGEVTRPIPFVATLSKNPKTLYVLWQEYQFGVGGRKAAKLFTAEERGKVKYNYSLRKPFWDLMDLMIREGYTFNTAIDKIYSVYNTTTSVTQVLRAIREDKKRGFHSNLL